MTSERLMHLVGELPVDDATLFFVLGQSGSQIFYCFISSSVLIAREGRRKRTGKCSCYLGSMLV